MSEAEAKTQLSVAPDQDFDVELESYPGSGAKWQFIPQGDVPRLVQQTTRVSDQGIGAAATQIFTFHSDAPGTYQLVFELKRAWEPSARNRKEIKIDVS